jgi:type I restriction enzyme, S subunit
MTFKEVQLQDILDIQWGDTKTTKASYVSDGYLAYSATGPDGFLEKFDYDREGIVLSAIGANCGSTFFASGKWSCIKNTIRILPKSGAIDLKYFFYMTKAPDFWPIRGSAQPFISQTDIRELYVQIPEISVQNAIGKILFELEQKISTNNALSKTLEDIAQTIFKSWFIDFDPVKAKMAGEKPVGMDAATAALFPDTMEESEIGLIPKGWGVRSIGDSVVKQKVGKLFDSKTSFPSGSTPVLDQGKSGVVGFHDEEPGVSASPDEPLVVFANHTCLLRLISYPFSVIQNVFPLVGNKVDVIWLYFAVEGKQQFDSYKGHWPDFVLHKIIHPTEQATNVFRLTVEPLLKQKWLLEQQSKMLANLRDSLLPRLISGELQIPEEMLAS